MKQQSEQGGYEGRLPAMAPLANPYVPFQMEDPPRYDAPMGLVRGTLYPGLDLPFRGMVNRKELDSTPMTELQTLGFAVQELALYLDTHREDQEALALYREYQKRYCQARNQLGPMNHFQLTDREGYRWLDGPWPWEPGKHQEG